MAAFALLSPSTLFSPTLKDWLSCGVRSGIQNCMRDVIALQSIVQE
jgi:hypothetical protein